ncbi:hypothetical protein SAMN05421823_103626 [Catalinimonas alkaloidigena]|uniref:Tetratricopeptide repeat-containing protein n=1 Tax=Catalinimonas alkaloidigena TaxID=1075417 RepID=A0A1G9EZB4_9BACT|nr:hypothetical protein [Catalinimonas alkaloidigena]SDK81383.1 hypothetical protein SAMN05421823_103626 [Catalinimonas alkaloidigena]
MDDLKTIIATFSAEEQKRFAQFVQRQRTRKDRKDLQLFRLLRQARDVSTEELSQRLYPEAPNPVAYYAVRQRLLQQVIEFILLKRWQDDQAQTASITGLLSLAEYLLESGHDALAWQFLRKAAQQAEEREQFDLLQTVLHRQLEHADSDGAEPLEELITRWQANRQRVDEEARATVAYSVIRQRLQNAKQQGLVLDFEAIVEEVLRTYDLTGVVGKRPRLAFQLVQMARSAVLVRKDFYAFEPFLLERYRQVAAEPGFGPHHWSLQVGWLYLIAHVQYRNRKFRASLDTLASLQPLLAHKHHPQFQPASALLRAANQAMLGELPAAIAQLEALLQHSALPVPVQLNARLNLAFYLFQTGDYRQANRVLQAIRHTDGWCEKKMGKEWVLKRNLSELILHYELGDPDLVEQKLRSIDRRLGKWLQQPAYANVRVYLQFLKKMLAQPTQVTHEAFQQDVEASFAFAPTEQEDLQSMQFYAWLKAKMVRRPYAEVLRELTHLL